MLAFIGHYGVLLIMAFGLYLSWMEHLKFDAEVKAGKWKRLDSNRGAGKCQHER